MICAAAPAARLPSGRAERLEIVGDYRSGSGSVAQDPRGVSSTNFSVICWIRERSGGELHRGARVGTLYDYIDQAHVSRKALRSTTCTRARADEKVFRRRGACYVGCSKVLKSTRVSGPFPHSRWSHGASGVLTADPDQRGPGQAVM